MVVPRALVDGSAWEQVVPGDAGPTPWSLLTLDETPSTQTIAMNTVDVAPPFGVLALRQTAGRGRDGRVWDAPAGNLNFSARLCPQAGKLQPAFYSLLAGIAVHQAVAAFMPGHQGLVLKWPNDLLLRGGKLAGVLIDCATNADHSVDWVVIGVGVNLAHAPAIAGRQTACLAQAGVQVAPRALALRIMAALDEWGGRNLEALRVAWLERAHPVGTWLRVHGKDRVVEGRFAGLDEDGALLLDGVPGVRSGEVEFLGK